MSSLRFVEKQHFEDILGMSGGYVLSFTNETFAEFFRETVDKNIHSEEYANKGDSKANRLRAFWEVEPDPVVGEVLLGMLEIWRYGNLLDGLERDPLYFECLQIAERLRGREDQEQESQFLEQELGQISFEGLPIDAALIPVLEYRLSEAWSCLQAGAPLAVVFLCGSVLEGMLLGVARQHPEEFNRAGGSPRDESGRVRPFSEWSLSQMIDVACGIGYLTDDVRAFSHSVRDYRNYIHPFKQLSSGFWPDEHTAKLCFQVLNAAVACLSGRRGSPVEEHAD
jgi:hypothetical protein